MGSALLGFDLWLPLKLEEDGLVAQGFPLGSCDFCANPHECFRNTRSWTLPAVHCTSIFHLCGTGFFLATKHHPQLPISVSSYVLQVCRFLLDPPLFIARKLKISPISQSSFTTVQGSAVVQDLSPGRNITREAGLAVSPLKAKRAQKRTVPCLFSLKPFMNLY